MYSITWLCRDHIGQWLAFGKCWVSVRWWWWYWVTCQWTAEEAIRLPGEASLWSTFSPSPKAPSLLRGTSLCIQFEVAVLCHSPFLFTVRALFIIVITCDFVLPHWSAVSPPACGCHAGGLWVHRGLRCLAYGHTLQCWMKDFMKPFPSSVLGGAHAWHLACPVLVASHWWGVARWPRTWAEESDELGFQSWLTTYWLCDGGKLT